MKISTLLQYHTGFVEAAELLDATSLIGPPGWVAERVVALRESGVTYLNVSPVGRTTAERAHQIELLRDLVD